MLQILDVVIKRMAYPEWCEIAIEADDAQSNYQNFRELLKVMFKNLSFVEAIKVEFLQRIS